MVKVKGRRYTLQLNTLRIIFEDFQLSLKLNYAHDLCVNLEILFQLVFRQKLRPLSTFDTRRTIETHTCRLGQTNTLVNHTPEPVQVERYTQKYNCIE